ncbi:MAG TPA: protein kinase [Kofleriaceae bacterium]|nr:protein kinase [Kofleriaceae bacterium]
MARTKDSAAGKPAVQLGRALASPAGVLVTIPLLVIAVGVGILLLGRDATRTSAHQLARGQLTEQALRVQSDVAFALDQADPLMARVDTLADPAMPVEERLVRLHDLIIGRPGVSYLSISFPDGSFYHSNATRDGKVEVQQSVITDHGTQVNWFSVDGGRLVPLRNKITDYDPRKRGFYQLAVKTRARAWTEPYTFFLSHETGITCTQPVFNADHTLRAVLTVDFDVSALSSYVAKPALDQARSIVYSGNGVVLAYPTADQLAVPNSDKLLTREDLKDPALDALFGAPPSPELHFLQLSTRDGAYLASVAPIGGRRAGVQVPLDWYVATLVPERTLLGPTRRLEQTSALASAGALAIAVALALVLAWNLLRMRRQVAASREEARTAQARARELGSYRLVAKLGAGGMGEVWRAEHRMLARTAAIKLIRPDALRDPDSVEEIRERFRREAQTLASMRSRHTIAIYDYGVTEAGVFYYVMELLEGLDMESLVMQYGAQPAARVIQLMIQACASLAEAHEAGLLHRDIKPPNLFVSRAADELDIVKLLDFGIVQTVTGEPHPAERARALIDPSPLPTTTDKLTQLGAMLGTPGFMAPEQILGMQLDGRADLYALGCVAWWLLEGNEVFKREGAEAKILHKHIYEPVPPLRERVRGWCPPELEVVLASCLAKDAEQRPANARALAAMLRAIPIPPEHAWTEDRARAWWEAYKPAHVVTDASTGEVQVIMPGRTEERPLAATSEDAIGPTIAEPIRRRTS